MGPQRRRRQSRRRRSRLGPDAAGRGRLFIIFGFHASIRNIWIREGSLTERRAPPRGGWSGEGPARARAEEGVGGWLSQDGPLPPAQVCLPGKSLESDNCCWNVHERGVGGCLAAAMQDSICVLSEGLAGLAQSETRPHWSFCRCMPVRHRGPIACYSQWLSTTGLRSIENLVVIIENAAAP